VANRTPHFMWFLRPCYAVETWDKGSLGLEPSCLGLLSTGVCTTTPSFFRFFFLNVVGGTVV
jgi:hypothetical protein